MTLKDLFTKEGRHERSLRNACAKAVNKKIKSDDRRPALYAVLEEARVADRHLAELQAHTAAAELQSEIEIAQRHGDEAVRALLARFTFNYADNIVNDEEEKTMVYDGLVALGARILPQVRRHLKESPTLSWGLRLLHEICDHETTWTVLSTVLQDYDAEYERDPSRKIQLMTFLGDFPDTRAVDALLPFVGDHDETVRYVTIESLVRRGDERAREPLLQAMVREEEESGRIRHRIAAGFAETGWLIKGFRGTVEKLLPPEYIVDGKGKIKLKKARDDEA